MKTKFLTSVALLAMTCIAAQADITVNLPQGCKETSISYYYAPIKKYAAAKTRAERGVVTDSVAVKDGKAIIAIPATGEGYMYGLNIENNNVPVYVSSGDNVNIKITGCNPFTFSLSGTGIADGMNELNALTNPIMEKAMKLQAEGTASPEEMNALGEQYLSVQKEFIQANPEGPAAGVALLNLDGEDFISLFEAMPAGFNNSILFPLAEQQYESQKKAVEMEKKQNALQAGDITVPNFTLKDLEGKDVSLSDFRGKWVILDFWGSWCPWCIKGFPELKEAYQKYAGELEIIGIDCRETEAEWKAGVEKYQLPWVNVYNPADSSVLSDYAVQGFPTKAIINPEGKIANITVGHNPEFFTILSKLMGK